MSQDSTQGSFASIPLGAIYRSQGEMFMKMCDRTGAPFLRQQNGAFDFKPAIDFNPAHVVELVNDVWLAE